MHKTAVTVEPHGAHVVMEEGRLTMAATSQGVRLHVKRPTTDLQDAEHAWATLALAGDGIEVEIELTRVDVTALVAGLTDDRGE